MRDLPAVDVPADVATLTQSRLRSVALARATPLSIACCTPSVDVPAISMMRYVASLTDFPPARVLCAAKRTPPERLPRRQTPLGCRETPGRREGAHVIQHIVLLKWKPDTTGGADPGRLPPGRAPAERDRRRGQPHHRPQPGAARPRLHPRADRATEQRACAAGVPRASAPQPVRGSSTCSRWSRSGSRSTCPWTSPCGRPPQRDWEYGASIGMGHLPDEP